MAKQFHFHSMAFRQHCIKLWASVQLSMIL